VAPSSRRWRHELEGVDVAAMSTNMETLRVGIIGAGWMGHVHARAYQRLGQHWPTWRSVLSWWRWPTRRRRPPSRSPALTGVATQPISIWPDWRELLADPELAAVSVTAPNFLHREIGVAVARGRQTPVVREAGRAHGRRRHGGP
jgi:hypothetical protein